MLGKFIRLAGICAMVVWLFFVTLNYYVVHKPFGISNLLALLSAVGDLALFLVLASLSAAIGSRMTRHLDLDSAMERLVLQVGLGWGVLSLATFTLGLAGQESRVVFWSALALALLLLRNDLRTTLADLRAIRLPANSRFEFLLAAFAGATLTLALIRGLTPPLAWDSQVYHLTEAKYWIEQGRIAPPPDIVYFSFPSLMESLYLGALVLKGDTLAQVIHWGFLVLTLALTLQFGLRFFPARVGWLAAAVLSAVPSLVLVASWAYVDLALAFYCTAALYACSRAVVDYPSEMSQQRRWLMLAGVFIGQALGVKYTAIFALFALALVLLIHSVRARQLRSIWYLLAPAILVASPWYLRNLLFQGNPFYPFLLGGPFWDSFRAQWFARVGSGLMQQPLRLLLAPWEATMVGQEGALEYEATIGPFLLLFIPLLLFTRPRSPALRVVFGFSGILYLSWLFGLAESKLLWQTRLLFPAFPALSLAAGVGFDRLRQLSLPRFSIARVAGLAVAMILALTLAGQTLDLMALDPFPFLAGYESRPDFLARRLTPTGYYSAVQFLSRLRPDAKVLFLWEPRSYYVPAGVKVAPDVLLDRFGDLQYRFGRSDSIADALRAQGYTHILLSRTGLNYFVTSQYDPVPADELRTLASLLANDCRPVGVSRSVELASDGALADVSLEPYALFEILPSGSARR